MDQRGFINPCNSRELISPLADYPPRSSSARVQHVSRRSHVPRIKYAFNTASFFSPGLNEYLLLPAAIMHQPFSRRLYARGTYRGNSLRCPAFPCCRPRTGESEKKDRSPHLDTLRRCAAWSIRRRTFSLFSPFLPLARGVSGMFFCTGQQALRGCYHCRSDNNEDQQRLEKKGFRKKFRKISVCALYLISGMKYSRGLFLQVFPCFGGRGANEF